MKEQTDIQKKFVETLFSLNKTMEALFKSGDVSLFTAMNREIRALYALQHGSEDPVMQAVDAECGVIYGNFDMIVNVLRTTEDGVIDAGAQSALNRLLHNIDSAVVNIAEALGIV